MSFTQNGRTKSERHFRLDKGYGAEIDEFLRMTRGEAPATAFGDLVGTTLTTFAIEKSLRVSRPVDVSELDHEPDAVAPEALEEEALDSTDGGATFATRPEKEYRYDQRIS